MSKTSPEQHQSPEFEIKPASIRLEFFRHDEKSKDTAGGDRTGDEFVRLTEQGRIHSTEAGKTKNPHPEVAMAFGSPRERSLETAMRRMLAKVEAITPDSSLEDIQALVSRHVKLGKKHKILPTLNFDWDTNPEFKKEAYSRFRETKDAMAFLHDESDNLVKKNKDTTSTSYSRMAGGMALLVKKYLEILPTWKRTIAEKPEKFAPFDNQMERYFGSHAVAVELLLMKIMEKTGDKESLDRFLIGDKKNGFGLSEGYSITITDAPGQPIITAKYGDKTWQITPEILDEIIQDGQNLEQEVLKL